MIETIKWNDQGLVPAIVQDSQSLQVLMLGYMNEEALSLTLSTGMVTFYSRSRSCLWTKGESSGNTLKLASMKLDCDRDTLLLTAVPAGPTCHTGATSCFFEDMLAEDTLSVNPGQKKSTPPVSSTLDTLMETVQDRIKNPLEGSYTNYLLDKGLGKILKKVGEESSEIIIAALSEDNPSLVGEIGDLLYHLTVMMALRGVSWQEILELLDARASS